jgi:four helix bundle protein
MDEQTFKKRTKQLALRVIELVTDLPNGKDADVLGRQILRSGTSVGANYRAACRARSTADLVNKLGIVEEEADETGYWLDLLSDSGLAATSRVQPLLRESDEILAMTVASIKTRRSRI